MKIDMKNNKLIAEFMGLDIISLEQFLVGVQSTIARIKIDRKDYICPMVEGYLLEHLQYHTSWDWLMPVVEKCLTTDGQHYVINDALLTCNIDELYQSVLQFIKQQKL
tara:strand:+ start:489 stop:812 length:324 start_codon:yes stop_codon:yes gene_type:complete